MMAEMTMSVVCLIGNITDKFNDSIFYNIFITYIFPGRNSCSYNGIEKVVSLRTVFVILCFLSIENCSIV